MGKKKSSESWYNSEGFRETTEDFHHRLDWQRQHRVSPEGKSYAQQLAEQRQNWKARRKVGRVMPVDGRPSQASIAGTAGHPARVERTKNPAPNLSACYASAAHAVSGVSDVSPFVLRLPLVEDETDGLFLPSLKLFRWESQAGVWLPVMDSGYDAATDVAWGTVAQDGIYIAVALPRAVEDMDAHMRLYRQRHALQAQAQDGTKQSTAAVAARAQALLDGGAATTNGKSVARKRSPKAKAMNLHAKAGKPIQLPEWTLMDAQLGGWQGTQAPQLTLPYDSASFVPIPEEYPACRCSLRGWAGHGPYNYNGRVKSIAVHPTNSNIVYAAAANGGLWRTEDAGLTWRTIWPSDLPMAFGSIAICRSSPNILVAATGELTPGYGSHAGAGVYRSLDGGDTWEPFGYAYVGTRIAKVEIHTVDHNRVYLASEIGLYVSNLRDDAFVQVLPGTFSDLVMDPNNPNIVYAAKYQDGIYKTVDGGMTWAPANGGWLFPPPFPRPGGEVLETEPIWAGIPTGVAAGWIKLAIGKNGPLGSNYLICKLGPEGSQLFASTNAGQTWEPTGTVPGVPYATWTSTVAIHPNDPNLVLAGDVFLFRRTASNSPFVQTSGTHADHHTIAFDPNNANVIWVATDGGVYRSTDGGATWVNRSYLLVATQLYDFGVSQQDEFFLAASPQDQGLIRTNGSYEWRDMTGSEGGLIYVDPNNWRNVYTCPWFNNLMRSRDGGDTFQYIHSGLSVVHDGRVWNASRASAISVRPGVSNELLTTVVWFKDSSGTQLALNRVFRSTDQGGTWQQVLATDGEPLHVQHNPWAGQVCYVGTSRGKLYRSVDGGLNWTQPNAWQTGRPQVSLSAMEIASGYLVGIATGAPDYKLYISIDSGTMFTNRSGQNPATQLPAVAITSIVFHPTAFGVYYVSTDLGVFRTLNGGEDWEAYNDGLADGELPHLEITRMRLRQRDMRLFVSTFGRGMYFRQL